MGLFTMLSTYRRPDRSPKCIQAGANSSKPVVVALGDSLTHGWMTADWVPELANLPVATDYQVVNAGVNSQMSHNVLQRLQAEVVALRPVAVILLIGTNDAIASLSEAWCDKTYVPNGILKRNWRDDVDGRPGLESYRANLTAIVGVLMRDTEAVVSIASPPPLGEDFDGPVNKRVAEFGDAVKQVVKAADTPRVQYLGLNEALHAHLQQQQQEKTETTPAPATRLEFPYETPAWSWAKIAGGNTVRYHVMGRSWSSLGEKHGLTLTHDCVHLTEPAGDIYLHLVEKFLAAALPTPPETALGA